MDNSSNNLSISNNNDIIAAEEDIGNFTELDNYINNEINSGHYEINLNKSYKYVDGDVNEIEINHKNHGITIYGNNHFIDANNSNSRIFLTFTYDTAVVLKDITFLNAHSQNGAIYTRNPDLVIDNCTFENNSGKYGGAMYIAGNNSQIINCTFRNNSATTSGGAIHIGSVNVTISGSKFDNNIAANYGGAININNKNATIVNCNFNNNNVTNKDRTNGGGAICLQKSINSTISKSTFTNLNGGGSGGAIYVTSGSDNVTIDSCSFNNTESYVEGGAICSSYFNKLTITNCNFTECEVTNVAKSNPGSYGGAIRGASHSNNLIIMGCIFDSNTAHLNAGGAIEYYGVNITVTNCDFKNNTAHSDGGAIYCHSTGFVNITGCNFTGNKIEEAYLKGTPMGPFSGGAILLRKNPTNYDSSDVSYVPLETFIINCRFVDNVAPGFGGGVCIRTDAYNPQHLYDYKHNATFDDCYFDGNNATLGSAIYIYKTCYVNISDTVFGENRANSSSIQPMVEKNGVNHTDNNVKFYYLSDVPTHVNFTAWDNIANAIWNSGYSAKSNPIDIKTPGKIDDISGDVNQVQLKNVTFDIYRNGAVEQMVTPNSYVTPKEGYANSNNGDDVWQDTLEDNQLIYLTLVNDDNNTIVYQNEQFTTDVPGNISRVFKNLKPGNYTLKASHPKDVYYTQISNTISFEVVEILNISKTTTDIDVFVGDIVTYTITIQNTKDVDLKNVTVKDDAPDSFILLDNYTSSWNKKGDDTFVYNGILGAKSSITLTVSYRTTKTGKYNNTVFVSTNETNPLNTTSENTTVRAHSTVNGTNVTVTYGDAIEVAYNSTNATGVSYEIFYENGTPTGIKGVVGPDGVVSVVQLPVGNYTVKWNNTVDSIHTPANNVSSIEITPAPSSVEGVDQVVVYNETIEVPVSSVNATSVDYQVIDSNNNVVASGSLVPGANITGLDLAVGTYTVNLTARVDGNHTESNNTCKITVNPAPSTVQGENVTVTYGEPIVVPYTSDNSTAVVYQVIDKSGNVVAKGTVDSIGSLTGLDLAVGNYTVNWTTKVDGNHTVAYNQSAITVNPAPSVVEGENVTVTYGEPIVVPYTSDNSTAVVYHVIDKSGNVVAKGTVDSIGSLTGLDLAVGNYTVNWTTKVDGNHTVAYNQSAITVNPAPSVVEGENVTVTYGEPIVVPYTSENATSIIYEIIDEDGKVVANGTVGSDGSLTGLDLPVGNYTVNWTTKVDGNHTVAYNQSAITVNPAPSTVQGENVTVTYGEPIVVPVTSENATSIIYEIIDEDGNVIVNGTINPGDNITGLDLPVGNYTVNWTTKVDGNHTVAYNQSAITVNPAPSVVEGENVTVTYGEPIVVPVTSENATSIIYEIIDEDGNVIVNGTINPGDNITGLDLPVGNYTVNWTTKVDGNHTVAYNQSAITVNPAPSVVEGENVTVTYGEPIVVPVTSENATSIIYEIIDEDGNVIVNGTINPGDNITGLDLPVGNYTVNWTTKVDGNHTVAYNQSAITVNPAPSVVEGENVTVTYGEPIVVPVTSENATSIIYEIIDEDGNVIVNGTINPGDNITGLDLPVGNYTVNWTTKVDGNHTVAYNQSAITVNPAPSVVEGENVTVTYGEPIVVPYTSENATSIIYEIIDEDGKVVANGTVGSDGSLTGLDLPVGNYTVNWTTKVDGNHTVAYNQSAITVNPAPSTVQGENVTVTYGEPIVVPVTSENATSIIYEIIDEDGNVIVNGTINPGDNITGLDLPVGNYTVNWTTKVDGNHTSATNSSMITVNPAPSTVQGENVTVTYGESIVVPYTSENATSIIYEIIDDDGNVVANGTVGSDGSLTGLDLPVGNYTVNWTTKVDGNHTVAYNQSSITVNPAPSVVEGENVTVTYGEPIVVPYTSENATSIIYEIIDEDGNVVANGTVGSDGSLTGLDLPVGNYTVNWTTVVDGNHTSATNSSMITVNPAPSTVQGENVTVTYGEPIVVPVTSENATSITYEIIDEDGNVIVNGTIGPGENITGIDLPVGNYTVNLTTVVDGNHTVNTNQSSITVNPAPSTVQGENVTTYVGYPIEVPIISENATSIIYEIIDEGGNVVANGTIGPGENITGIDLPVGNYTVNLTTVVDGNHTSATNTSTITVQAIPTQVTIGNITSYPGENVTIPITVTIFDDQPFTGNVAVIMPDNTTQIVSVVNGTGTVTWYVPDDYTPDKYPDSIRFPGSDVYLPSNGTGIIEVVKIPTKITVGNVTTYPGRDVTIPINVAADDGKPFNGKVTVTLPDGTTKVVEIVNGKGSVDWSVPSDYTPDKYPDTVRFAGDNKYLPSEGKGTITVVKIPVDIIVGNVTAKPGEHVTIPIKVIPRDGSVFNGKVTVELPDGTKKVIDIVNGEGSVDWIVPDDYRGVFPIKVSFDGSVVYYPAEGTGFITVIPDEHPVENKTATPIKDLPKDNLKHYETGNPIMALLALLALLGVGIRRRK